MPPLPVLRRRHDRGVLEDRLGGVGGEVVRHEGQLDDRVEVQAAQVVVDPVDAGEVVHRLAVDLAVDADVVVEDGVRPHVGHAELLPGRGQRRGELLADHLAPDGVGRQRVREVLAADHRPPRARQLTGGAGHVDADHHGRRGRPTAARSRPARRARPRRARRSGSRRGTTARRRACRSCRRTAGAAPRARRGRRGRAAGSRRRVVGGVHLVADGTGHLGPGQGDLLAARLGPDPGRRVEPRRVTAEGRVGPLADPVLPVAAGVLRTGWICVTSSSFRGEDLLLHERAHRGSTGRRG